jgi:hypothetical protein
MNSFLTGQVLIYVVAGVALVLAALQLNGQVDLVTPIQDILNS